VLDDTGDIVLAEAEALATFDLNAAGPGNGEMASSYANGELTLSVQFSNTLHPFAPGTTPAQYVRVRATEFRLPGWFIPVLGIADKTVGASAVAGPSPTFMFMACNVAPMMVCGDSSDPGTFGYEIGETTVLKAAAPGSAQMGPGNFQMIVPEDGPGANEVRQAMAGSFDNCFDTTQSVETQPGNMVAVIQGLNTRFGEYFGAMNSQQSTYPPDVITQEPTPQLTYDDATDTIYYGSQPVDGDPPHRSTTTHRMQPIWQPAITTTRRSTRAATVLSGGARWPCRSATAASAPPDRARSRYWASCATTCCRKVCTRVIECPRLWRVRRRRLPDQRPPGSCTRYRSGPYIIQLYKDHDAEAS
jgi:hypothetical protein